MKNMIRVAACLSLVAVAGCASKPIKMRSSGENPAAEGMVKAERSENDNTKLNVQVKHLAPPQRVSADATTYVVWVESATDGTPTNVGALDVNREREGELETVTPLRDFKVIITAESSGMVEIPEGPEVMSANVQAG